MKNLKKSILALALVAAVLAAGIFLPVAGEACEEGPVVGYFLDYMIEGS